MAASDKTYILKLYDDELVRFRAKVDVLGNLLVDIEDADQDFRLQRPIKLINEVTQDGISSWLRSRTVPKNRQYVEALFAQAGLSQGDTLGIIDVCKGLSVNDAFWVDQVGNEQLFKDVNLYDNELDEVLSLVAYTGFTNSQHKNLGLSTEWTTSGSFAKAWRRINDELVLYKAGSEGFANAGMEPYSEYLAAQLANRMELDVVNYDLEKWNGKLASTCPLLNNKDTALVPFGVATGISAFPTTLAIVANLSNDFFEKIRTMTVFDALICNTDRHGGNFGFLRNNKGGNIFGFAPLYDHNLSLFVRDMRCDFAHWNTRADTVFAPALSNLHYKEQCNLIMGELQHEQLRKAIGFEFVNHPSYPIPEDRLNALNTYITNRTTELLNIPIVDEQNLRNLLKSELGKIEADMPYYDFIELLDVEMPRNNQGALTNSLDERKVEAQNLAGSTYKPSLQHHDREGR